MKKHYCQCGCGQEVGVYSYTSRKFGFTKGQPKRYMPGHSRKNWTEGSSMLMVQAQRGREIYERIKKLRLRAGDIIDVDIFWDANENNLHRTVIKKCKILQEYPNYYLVDAGNYKTTQLKADLILREG